MQSLKSERAKKEYEQFVKEVTPKQNLFCNMAKAFIVGGLICVVGQILLHIGKTQFSLSKDDAGSWCSLILILSSVILTGQHLSENRHLRRLRRARHDHRLCQLGCSSCD